MSADTSFEVSYGPGSWVAVAANRTWLLLDVPASHPSVMAVWNLVTAGAAVDEILDVLVADGIRAAPAFALVHLAADERRVLVRGAGNVRVIASDGGELELSAATGTAWGDHLIEVEVSAVLIRTSAAATGEVELPMAGGVTSAGHLHLRPAGAVTTSAAPVTVAPDVVVLVEPVATEASEEPEVVVTPEAVAEPTPEPTLVQEVPIAILEPEVSEVEPEPEPVEVPVAEQLPATEEVAEAGASYDFLFGATRRPLTEDELALVNEAPPAEPLPAPPPQQEPVATEPPAPMAPVVETIVSGATQGWSTQSVAATSGLIDALPWTVPGAAPVEPVPAPVVAVPSATADRAVARGALPQEVRTVSRAQVLADAAAAAGGPRVLAVRCPVGHLTSVQSVICRVCRTPVAEQASFEVTRPTLGTLKLSTGDVVTLDRNAVFGRAPDVHVEEEHERPNVVRLASPTNEISRNHAEVVLDGWTVFVRDLGSTNGTMVTLPGQEPVRLRSQDHFALEAHAVVSLSDEVTMTFEVGQ